MLDYFINVSWWGYLLIDAGIVALALVLLVLFKDDEQD